MESRMTELMEAIQESEGQAERRVLTLLGGRYISEKALVIGGKIVWESRKNGYFHGYTDAGYGRLHGCQRYPQPGKDRQAAGRDWDSHYRPYGKRICRRRVPGQTGGNG